jgi:bifunctional UDP-N-acetylglucosamine pyrophosphorylase/glucosamine-1-phosphate N-acetyltransferase
MRLLYVAILAAGKGTRMKSNLPKVLHPVAGKPMLLHVIDLAKSLAAQRIISIIGHGKEKVMEVIRDTQTEYVVQDQQLGTAHAVLQLEALLNNLSGDLLVLSGDVPLLRKATVQTLIQTHANHHHAATLLTTVLPDPTGYGRIIRRVDGTLKKIVEHKDCTPEELAIKEINGGIYLFDVETLFPCLHLVTNDNRQKEYYLPDVLPLLINKGKTVALQMIPDSTEILGVNTIEELQRMNLLYQKRHA